MALADRRQFMKHAASLTLGWCASSLGAANAPELVPNPVGYHAIAWPRREFDQALAAIAELGFKGVQMLGWVREKYGGSELPRLKERLRALKLQPVALSCSKIDLDPDHPKDESHELRAYAAFLQALGGLYLQVTDGGKPDREYSAPVIQALGARMNALGKLAQDFGLTLGYHPHFNTVGETREGMARVLEATDPRSVKIIADVGHLALGGADPVEVIRTYHERLLFFHFKDVRRDTMELARKNRDLVRGTKYRFCEIATGALDFPAIIQAFRDTQFKGWVIVELDRNERRPGGPAESGGMNKAALQRLGLLV